MCFRYIQCRAPCQYLAQAVEANDPYLVMNPGYVAPGAPCAYAMKKCTYDPHPLSVTSCLCLVVAGPQIDFEVPATALANRLGSFSLGSRGSCIKDHKCQVQSPLLTTHPELGCYMQIDCSGSYL